MERLPIKERVELRNKKIRDLHRLNYSTEEISSILNVSRTTIFFVINGRTKKKKIKK